MGAEKASWEGALRQMSVPGGEERVKGESLVVLVASVIGEVPIKTGEDV